MAPSIGFQPHPQDQLGVIVRLQGYNDKHVLSFGDGRTLARKGGQSGTVIYAEPGWYRVEAHQSGTGSLLAAAMVRVVDAVNPGTWAPDPTNDDFYQLTIGDDGSGVIGQITIDWGDGDEPDTVWAVPGSTVERDLDPGQRSITITDLGSKRIATETHTVTGHVYDPNVTLTADPADASRMTAVVTFVEVTDGKAVNIWFDQGDPVKVPNPKANDTTKHKYTEAGSYPVVVAYEDGSGDSYADIFDAGTQPSAEAEQPGDGEDAAEEDDAAEDDEPAGAKG